MIKRNSANERVKRRYLQHRKETKGRDESSLDAVAKRLIPLTQVPLYVVSEAGRA
jgi:hypothetical protein